MRHALKTSVSVMALAATAAAADCGIEIGSVRILSNDFPALGVVNAAARTCATDSVTVTSNQTAEHASLQVPALTVDPAIYTVAVVANDSVVPLLNAGLIRPLDELVAAHGQGLEESQLVRIDGKIIAIAFMINAQHLYLREDMLAQAGLEPPTSYEEILAAAAAIREQGLMENPLAASLKPGWDLAAEFVNMYIGFGGALFEPGGAALAIDNDAGLAALDMLKALSGFMSRDFVTYDTNAMQSLWESGQAAIENGWGSRAAAVLDPGGPAPEIAAATTLAAAPTVGGGDIPATTLRWDGFTIAANIPDADAEASFRAMIHAASPATAQANPSLAAWLMEGYEPAPAAMGVIETLNAGAKPYPMVPYMGILHSALGANLGEFLQGQETAEQAQADVARAYETAATEAGFLQ